MPPDSDLQSIIPLNGMGLCTEGTARALRLGLVECHTGCIILLGLSTEGNAAGNLRSRQTQTAGNLRSGHTHTEGKPEKSTRTHTAGKSTHTHTAGNLTSGEPEKFTHTHTTGNLHSEEPKKSTHTHTAGNLHSRKPEKSTDTHTQRGNLRSPGISAHELIYGATKLHGQ